MEKNICYEGNYYTKEEYNALMDKEFERDLAEGHQVVCWELNRTYNTITDASNITGVSMKEIIESCRYGTRDSLGNSWNLSEDRSDDSDDAPTDWKTPEFDPYWDDGFETWYLFYV